MGNGGPASALRRARNPTWGAALRSVPRALLVALTLGAAPVSAQQIEPGTRLGGHPDTTGSIGLLIQARRKILQQIDLVEHQYLRKIAGPHFLEDFIHLTDPFVSYGVRGIDHVQQ